MKKSNADERFSEKDVPFPKSQEKESYWDIAEKKIPPPIYPQLGTVSFTSFIKKIVLGLVFAFLPALTFGILSGIDIFYIWGIALLLVSGVYFVAAGWRDFSATSAKKSRKQFMERSKMTKEESGDFKFSLGLSQFGTFQEDIGAAICLFGISAIILTFFG